MAYKIKNKEKKIKEIQGRKIPFSFIENAKDLKKRKINRTYYGVIKELGLSKDFEERQNTVIFPRENIVAYNKKQGNVFVRKDGLLWNVWLVSEKSNEIEGYII